MMRMRHSGEGGRGCVKRARRRREPSTHYARETGSDGARLGGHVGPLREAEAVDVVVARLGQLGARLPHEEGHVDRPAQLLLAARGDVAVLLDLRMRGRSRTVWSGVERLVRMVCPAGERSFESTSHAPPL